MEHLAREDQEEQICQQAEEVVATTTHRPTSPGLPSQVAHLRATILVELRFLSQMQSCSEWDLLVLVEDCTAQTALAPFLITQSRLVRIALVEESSAWAQAAPVVERTDRAQAAPVVERTDRAQAGPAVESNAKAETALVVAGTAESLWLIQAMQVLALWAQASRVVAQRARPVEAVAAPAVAVVVAVATIAPTLATIALLERTRQREDSGRRQMGQSLQTNCGRCAF
jgi:hypothetical protein